MKVIAAEGEQKSSRALKEAADVIAQVKILPRLHQLSLFVVEIHLKQREIVLTFHMNSFQSPAALQLRYLQTLNTISAEKNSTIVFPIPIDMMQTWAGGRN